ncbi:HNH endonuclease [Burkholderia multivorans]|uniref:HNH endonuclease n=1 Tax=Burkholderia multivorans TaxID=87883 RepID=UPI001C23B4DF|nr:HNH endonuclease signature motif containing protein [Burkholderia multivorans]MBU9434828.1 HNH endonuclease [Burkholderia multivorans]
MVKLFPSTDIYVEMAEDVARRLVQLLERYNWILECHSGTRSDRRLRADRWRRFWRGVTQIERAIVVMYIQSNNGGAFGGTVALDHLRQALSSIDARRSRSRATDVVLREFAILRQVFIRACVNADEIAFRWNTTHRDAMELCGSALIDIATEWLASDGDIDLDTALSDQLLSTGLTEYVAQQTAVRLSLQIRYLIQDRQKAICDRARGGDGADRTDDAESSPRNGTIREQVVEARLGQGKYRDDVLAMWGNACAVTGCSVTRVVVASHAKPWADSTDDERLDPNNGLPLVATLDKLFDAGLIGFDPVTGVMRVSSTVGAHDRMLLGVPAPLRRKPNAKQSTFLRYHLDYVFQRETEGNEPPGSTLF